MILRWTQLISEESYCGPSSPLSLARFGAKQIPSILHQHHYFALRRDNGKPLSQSTSAATDGLTDHDSTIPASAPSPPPPPPPHSLKGTQEEEGKNSHHITRWREARLPLQAIFKSYEHTNAIIIRLSHDRGGVDRIAPQVAGCPSNHIRPVACRRRRATEDLILLTAREQKYGGARDKAEGVGPCGE